MMKTMLLAGTMAFASPALAQTVPPAGVPAPTTDQTAPAPAPQQTPPSSATADPAALPDAATPNTGTPPTTAPTPAPTPVQDAPDAAAAATPSHAQVSQVVDQQFGTYDRNGDGTLDKAEFAAWMDALKAQANAKTGSPAEQTAWNNAAFRQADGDRSASVTRTELTGFLVKGASGNS